MSGNRQCTFHPLLAFLALIAVGALPGIAAAEPDSRPRWMAHDPDSRLTIDHGAWDGFLKRFVRRGADGVNRVAYAEVGADGRNRLKAHIAGLAALPIGRYRRAEQFAFWVNLYNALTVDVVLDHYPVRSIRDIDTSPGLFTSGPWRKKLIRVGRTDLSLDDIEHRILRPIWREPRVHYVLNCASLGCPDLPRDALTATNADAVMERAARAYINHPRGVRLVGGKLFVSRVYRWFADDFGGGAGVAEHLRRYAEPGSAAALAGTRELGYGRYDWALNDCGGAGSRANCDIGAAR